MIGPPTTMSNATVPNSTMWGGTVGMGSDGGGLLAVKAAYRYSKTADHKRYIVMAKMSESKALAMPLYHALVPSVISLSRSLRYVPRSSSP